MQGQMKKKIYIATSKTGQMRVFTSVPERDQHFGIWCGDSVGCISMVFMLFESDGMHVPNQKWDDDPIELELSITVP